jgi:hypothetical protein
MLILALRSGRFGTLSVIRALHVPQSIHSRTQHEPSYHQLPPGLPGVSRSMSCPSENQELIDQTGFWNSDGVDWDAHRIGWAIAGATAALTVVLSVFSVLSHCRSYTNRNEQRQIIRILYMPPVYAIISFFSYRFFRHYTYYSLIEVVYEAVTLSAFLLLLIEYVASTASSHSAENAMSRKDKKAMPFPFCMWRYRPTKPYFMYTIKWSVLQYVIIRPAASVVAIICEHYHILCESQSFNFHYAAVYIEIVDFISISIALYGLLIFYGLTKEELSSRRPLAKFLAIKLIVMFTFYQSFVFSALEGRVIKGTPYYLCYLVISPLTSGTPLETDYWSVTNISNGLNALTICIEMVFFAGFMWWAYPANEYKTGERTSIWRPLWDSINFSDFVMEIVGSARFYLNAYETRRKRGHTPPIAKAHTGPGALQEPQRRPTFADAFGLHSNGSSSDHVNETSRDYYHRTGRPSVNARANPGNTMNMQPMNADGYTYPTERAQSASQGYYSMPVGGTSHGNSLDQPPMGGRQYR